MKNNNWVIVADGEPQLLEQMGDMIADKKLMVLDGALPLILEKQIITDVVLGDFDSVDKALLTELELQQQTKVVHTPDQNKTDLEKGLLYLQEQHAKVVDIIHATGWRLDHTLHNLRLLKRYDGSFDKLTMYTALETIFFIKDKTIELTGEINQPIAILGFPSATITSNGLEYDMQAMSVDFANANSISNHFKHVKVNIEIYGEALILMGSQLIKP